MLRWHSYDRVGYCGGQPCDDSPVQSSRVSSIVQLDPAQFAAVVDDDKPYVINVHVPDEGSIQGTDAAIPYNEIRDRVGDLPPDRSAPLAVYCRSGRMSTVAVATLTELGFTDVVELGSACRHG